MTRKFAGELLYWAQLAFFAWWVAGVRSLIKRRYGLDLIETYRRIDKIEADLSALRKSWEGDQ